MLQDLTEALQRFKAGDYEGCVPLARRAKESCTERTRGALSKLGLLADSPEVGEHLDTRLPCLKMLGDVQTCLNNELQRQ